MKAGILLCMTRNRWIPKPRIGTERRKFAVPPKRKKIPALEGEFVFVTKGKTKIITKGIARPFALGKRVVWVADTKNSAGRIAIFNYSDKKPVLLYTVSKLSGEFTRESGTRYEIYDAQTEKRDRKTMRNAGELEKRLIEIYHTYFPKAK